MNRMFHKSHHRTCHKTVTSDRQSRPVRPVIAQIAVAAAALASAGLPFSFGQETKIPAKVPTTVADAAEAADWSALEQRVPAAADINAAQPDGTTALHWTVHHDNTPMTSLLLRLGANAGAVNSFGVTPLSLACTNGNGDIVQLLLQSGADPNSTASGGETALMTAARTGRTEPVRELLEAGANVNAADISGQTALMWSAAEGHADVIRLLLSSGADSHVTLPSGFSALFFAVREGRREAADVLLDAGIDVNSVMQPQTKGPRVPRNGTSPLMLAIENGHFELAAHLLDRGADPNDQRSGYSPLHALTWVRKPNSGDDVDGDPSPIGSGKLTSLQLVSQLTEHGADVNARLKHGRSGRARLNQTGATPFLMAADTADLPYMNLLLQLGADPTIPNVDGCLPLPAAAGIGTMAPGEEAGTEDEAVAAVRRLLDLGADINAVDDNGETAMHGAAYKNLPKMVQFLAEHGADISVWNRPNKYGWTPLLIAEGYRQGNFKPSAATVTALHKAMRQSGIEPPPPTAPRPPKRNDNYTPRKQN